MRENTGGRTARARRAGVVSAALALLSIGAVVLSGCSSPHPPPKHPTAHPTTPPATPSDPRALGAGAVFAAKAPLPEASAQVQQLQAAGQTAQADALQSMLQTPQAVWLSGGTESQVFNQVKDAIALAAPTGAVPVFVAYNVPERDCGDYSAGGAADAAAYAGWIGALSSAIGTEHAVVLLEPDSLGNLPSSCTRRTLGTSDEQRIAQISAALDRLEKQPAVSVYLDGTNSNWLKPATIAERLVKAGIERAQGFFLNVSNFQSTKDNEAFGDEVSARVQAVTGTEPHYVIDTGRNGAGADTMTAYRDAPYRQSASVVEALRKGNWCNPPSARLGEPPRAHPAPEAHPLLDAYLWVKTVGTSDGSCDQSGGARDWDYRAFSQPGWPGASVAMTGFDPLWGVPDPAAGAWFPQAALALLDPR